MRNFVAVLLAGLLALIGLVALLWMSPSGELQPVAEAPDTSVADAAAIEEIRRAHNAAFTAEDLDGFLGLFADNAQVQRNGSSVLVGKAAIRSWEEEEFGQFDSEMTYSSDEMELMGDVAFDRGTFLLTRTPGAGGDTNEYHGTYILISRRQADGSWKITQYMWNNRPAPER